MNRNYGPSACCPSGQGIVGLNSLGSGTRAGRLLRGVRTAVTEVIYNPEVWVGLPEKDVTRGSYLVGLQSYLLNAADKLFLASLNEAATKLAQQEESIAPTE